MKTIKIRFINRGKDYLIQKKTWFGWKYIDYTLTGGFGDTLCYMYCEGTKEELLSVVLENHYKIDRRFVNIIEYPEIKHY